MCRRVVQPARAAPRATARQARAHPDTSDEDSTSASSATPMSMRDGEAQVRSGAPDGAGAVQLPVPSCTGWPARDPVQRDRALDDEVDILSGPRHVLLDADA